MCDIFDQLHVRDILIIVVVVIFQIVLGQLSKCSHEELWCFRHPSVPPDTVFHQNLRLLS